MFKYKTERILFVIVWIALLCSLSIFIPQETITVLIQYQYVASSFIFALLIFNIYRKTDNYFISKKINALIFQNELDTAMDYVSKLIMKHPNLYWLKVKKLELYILSGDICEYQTFKLTISLAKKSMINYIVMMDNIVAFLNQGKIHSYNSPKNPNKSHSILENTNYLISNKDKLQNDKFIMLASEIYNCPIAMYRAISAVILSNYYLSIGNVDKMFYFKKKALSNAPSDEVRHYFNSIFNQ